MPDDTRFPYAPADMQEFLVASTVTAALAAMDRRAAKSAAALIAPEEAGYICHLAEAIVALLERRSPLPAPPRPDFAAWAERATPWLARWRLPSRPAWVVAAFAVGWYHHDALSRIVDIFSSSPAIAGLLDKAAAALLSGEAARDPAAFAVSLLEEACARAGMAAPCSPADLRALILDVTGWRDVPLVHWTSDPEMRRLALDQARQSLAARPALDLHLSPTFLEHLAWFVAYQCTGQSFAAIAQRMGHTRQAVAVAVRAMADEIGLPLRPANAPGRPRKRRARTVVVSRNR